MYIYTCIYIYSDEWNEGFTRGEEQTGQSESIVSISPKASYAIASKASSAFHRIGSPSLFLERYACK